jgi:hypothetical protein
VHDSHVNEDLRATLTRIEASQKTQPLPVVIANMGEFVLSNNCDITPEKRRLVFKSLEIIGRNQHIGTLQSTEGNVFKCVWDRAEDPSNVINETLIKNALAQSLVDFWENGANHDPVCINGRCSRMLASLVLLDYDDKVGIVQTKEMIKNEIIDLSTKIINSSIEQACASDNEGRRRVGESYMVADAPTPDPAEERKFIDELKQKIQTMLDLNYRDKLDKRDFENIRDDIFAGLE